MTKFCKVSIRNHVLTVTLNRPKRLNALHPPAHQELSDVFDEFANNEELWIAVITGEGRAFCAGNDLREQVEFDAIVFPEQGFAGLTSRFDLTKPVIAAVNGPAMGGGFEIALFCDLIVASDKAIFALPEPRLGLAALAGGLQRLPRQIGMKRALGMILTGRTVTAQEGSELGFVNEVVPHAELMSAVDEWVNQILDCAPLSIRASKDVVLRSMSTESLEEAMSTRYESVEQLIKSEDFKEGPRAFAAKRTPKWQGR
ncbi:MAG: enoyl-CoA hydratase [Gammaproteobacteria bacterium]|nr:enoyl-CoA hydratase [Gammaproteobacteria bacterium]MYF38391.1 enoyl-CoA hydratase [Gammaproteobacteria bacterium]